MNDLNAIALIPRVSEKSYGLSQVLNTYVFDVPMDVNRLTVKKAIETQFKVTVTGVNVAVSKGKVKRSFRKRLQPAKGKRSDTKRAYVTLKEGDSIPVFATADDKEKK